jgi:hypothetical protein
MSFILSSGNVQSPLNNGGVAYGTGNAVKVSSAGTAGQVLLSSGTGAPTWGTASAAGSVTAIASGTLPTGQAVIVNSNGTVSVATQNASNTTTFGTATVVQSSACTNAMFATYDVTNNAVVIVFSPASASYQGTAIVGKISGTTITFGSTNTFSSGPYITSGVCSYDSVNGAIVIAYQDSTPNYGRYIIGYVSGNNINFPGTQQNFSTNNCNPNGIAFDPIQNASLIIYYNATNTFATCIAGTTTGNTLSLGSSVTLNSTNYSGITYQTVCYDSVNQKMVVFYTVDNGGGGYNLCSRVITLTGTSISLGTETIIDTNGGANLACAYDSVNQRAVVFYKLIGYNYLSCRVCTVSGTSVSAGSRVDVSTTATTYIAATADNTAGKVIVMFTQSGTTLAAVGTVSGTTISFGTITTVNSSGANGLALTYDPVSKKLPFIYANNANSQYLTDKLGTIYATNVTTTNFVGFSSANYTNGQTATINTIGALDTNQTGLTPGSAYYVTNAGTLSTTADTPSVYAGVALAATKIIVKG